MRYMDSQENAIQTVRKAVSIGINHLETAQGYGNSEEYLGSAVADILRGGTQLLSREQLHITTKIPPQKNNLNCDCADLERCIDESLERLNVDYLDCLAIHGLNTREHLNWVLSSGFAQVVQTVVGDRRVCHLGFSTHGSLDLIQKAINTDLFEFVNLHYYYFFQRHAPAVELAHQKDMGVFIISAADKGGRLHNPSATLEKLCHPFSPLELNYRFLLSDPRVTTLSLGAANPKEVEAIASLYGDRDERLTPEEHLAIERLQKHAATTLGSQQCSQCYACLPCPEDINIPEVLRLRNLAIAYDMSDYGQYRYGMFENAGHWFPGMKASRCTECGDCLPRCPEHLNIPKLLQDTHDRLNGKSGRRLWS